MLSRYLGSTKQGWDELSQICRDANAYALASLRVRNSLSAVGDKELRFHNRTPTLVDGFLRIRNRTPTVAGGKCGGLQPADVHLVEEGDAELVEEGLVDGEVHVLDRLGELEGDVVGAGGEGD